MTHIAVLRALLVVALMGCSQVIAGSSGEAGVDAQAGDARGLDAVAMNTAGRDAHAPEAGPMCGALAPGEVAFVEGFPAAGRPTRHAIDLSTVPSRSVPTGAARCGEWVRATTLRVSPPDGQVFHGTTIGGRWLIAALDACDGSLLACGDDGNIEVPGRPDRRDVVLVVGAARVRGEVMGPLGVAVVELRAGPGLAAGERCRSDTGDATGVCGAGLRCTPTFCLARTSGLRCAADGACGPVARCVDGVCRTLLRAGGRCSSPFDACPTGEVCALRTRDELRCGPPLPQGAPCGWNSRYGECETGMVCTSAGCAPPLPPGAPCWSPAAPSQCAAGTLCVGGLCRLGGTEGERCVDSALPCVVGLVCGSEGRCVRPSTTQAPPCTDEGARCEEGRVCHEGRCVQYPNTFCRDARDCLDGDRCLTRRCIRDSGTRAVACAEQEPLCASGFVCQYNTCQPSPCAPACSSGARCVEGRCIPPGARGGPCRAGSVADACDAGLTCDDALNCSPTLEEGASCAGGAGACREGLVCDSSGCTRRGARDRACGAQGGRLRCDEGLGCDEGLQCRPVNQPAYATCRPTLPGACAAGLSCSAGTRYFCAVEGERRGRCRDRAPRCDEGLVCTVAVAGTSRCFDPAPEGARCVAQDDACEPGTVCARTERDGETRCQGVRAGTLHARCRVEAPACDAPFHCDLTSALCVPPSSRGMFCRAPTDCAEGLECVRGVCENYGGDGEFCRDDEPRCDAPLRCLGSRCARVPDGPSCVDAATCGAGNLCVLGRCRALGRAAGEPCAHREEACAPGLFCNPELRCEREQPEGEACATEHRPCGATRGCLRVEGSLACVPWGVLDARCRELTTPTCEPGLRCDPDRVCRRP